MLGPVLADARIALRSVARAPGFALVAVLTIAVGVGATTAVLSTANAVLVRPVPVPEPDRVVALVEERGGAVAQGMEGTKLPFPRCEAYRDGTAEIFEAYASSACRSSWWRSPCSPASARRSARSGSSRPKRCGRTDGRGGAPSPRLSAASSRAGLRAIDGRWAPSRRSAGFT